MPEPTMDAQGYPTDETLRMIREWPIERFSDCEALLEFVGRAWWHPEMFQRTARRRRPHPSLLPRHRWTVSTGGWSGNESLIDALEAHETFWHMCWESSRRGGHFEFEVPADA
jgi:hypothetical protein